MRLSALLLFALLLCLAPPAQAAVPQSYFYPFVNPYEATVMELPREFEVRLPDEVPDLDFVVRPFPKRDIPEVFWYEKGLECGLAYQKKPAPLVFMIAGSGSRYDIPRMEKLKKALHMSGFHVISLTSPTHMDFVVNASSGLPGIALEDARDLYRVMDLAYRQVQDRIEVTEFLLAGYSLGAFNAAFVSLLDEDLRRFQFRRVLLINTPVSLYDSVLALDRLLVDNIPGGMKNFDAWFRSVFTETMNISDSLAPQGLSGESLYRTYKRMQPSEENLAALIGLTSRMNAADMIFTADVMNGGGYLVPKNARFTSTTSLTRYAMAAYQTRFVDYFDEWLFPNYQKSHPGITRATLLDNLSLRSLEGYLRRSGKIGLIHNEDDIIMVPGDMAYLEGVFGERAHVFPVGGHLGNMFHPDVVAVMVRFLKGREEAP